MWRFCCLAAQGCEAVVDGRRSIEIEEDGERRDRVRRHAPVAQVRGVAGAFDHGRFRRDKDIFVDNTVRAIRSWRFKPYIKDGEAQEVVHELTVYYKLNES